MKFTIRAILKDCLGDTRNVRVATAVEAMNFHSALEMGQKALNEVAEFYLDHKLSGWDIQMDEGQDENPNYVIASVVAPIPNAQDRNPYYDRRN